jgi:hypothetical protein
MKLDCKQTLTILLFTTLTSCKTSLKTELYFGRNIPGGGQVSDSDWKNFSDTAIASRFSEGYTELAAQGRWMDKATRKTITENTTVVILMGKNSKLRCRQIDSIAQLYSRRFNQDAVMRFDSKGYLKFISK